jgi:hypothetical protein
MALRFRRRIRIAPGFYINIGKKGASVSVGVRGASIAAGQRGIFGNIGMPDTGLSYRSKITSDQSQTHQPPAPYTNQQPASLRVVLRLHDDGRVSVESEDGRTLSRRQLKFLKDEKGGMIQHWLEATVAEFNSNYDSCVNLHCETPSPTSPRWLLIPPFEEPPPVAPHDRHIRLVDRFLLRRRRIERENAERLENFRRARDEWTAKGQQHLRLVDEWRAFAQGALDGDKDVMETILHKFLCNLPWPRQTEISFDFGDDGTTLEIDVDLPEIEDMPDRTAAVASRGMRVNFRNRTDAQIRRDYLRLVHGITFRVAGETFANLPRISQVTVSGFTQRPDTQTGKMRDDFVISTRISREKWAAINFANLREVDPIDALTRFELIRHLDRAGRLGRVAPLRN